jgi:hypothetical protein
VQRLPCPLDDTNRNRLSHSKLFQGVSNRFKPFPEKKDCLKFLRIAPTGHPVAIRE